MGANVQGFGPKPISCTAKATNNLISDQQNTVMVADALDFGPISVWRNDHAARPLDRFGDKGGDTIGAQLLDRLFQLGSAGATEIFGGHIAPFAPPIGLIDMMDVRDWHAALFVHRTHPAKRPTSNS